MLIGIIVFLLMSFCAFIIYVSDYYHADDIAIEAASTDISINILSDNSALILIRETPIQRCSFTLASRSNIRLTNR
jgi:TRAP-type mannitol/chloroaromatic compound transport system permease small subunit